MKICFGERYGEKFVVQAQMFETLADAKNYIDKNINYLKNGVA